MKIKGFLNKYLKYIILLLAILAISIGLLREENRTVLVKAINICLECIGVG